MRVAQLLEMQILKMVGTLASTNTLKFVFYSRTIEAVQKSLKGNSQVQNRWPYCCGLNGEAGYFQPSVQIHNIDGQFDSSLSLKCSNPSLELKDDETPLFSHSEIKAFGH